MIAERIGWSARQVEEEMGAEELTEWVARIALEADAYEAARKKRR